MLGGSFALSIGSVLLAELTLWQLTIDSGQDTETTTLGCGEWTKVSRSRGEQVIWKEHDGLCDLLFFQTFFGS